VLERAGIAPYWGLQGRSLLPAVAGGEAVRDALVIEHHDGGARMGFDKPARARCLLTDRWRITVFKDEEWGELYDREADPRETRNLWDDEAHRPVRAELMERLMHEAIRNMEESPRATRLA